MSPFPHLKLFSLSKRFRKIDLFFLVCIFSLVFLLYIFRIETLMPFVGDQGWYYLSAYRLLTGVEFPLVGIASSHPWLHQGAFWTYLLAPALYIGQLNPISGFVVSLFFGLGTLVMFFYLCQKLFGRRISLIALSLYAFSPLIILQVRMPYHVSPIPFFTCWYIYSLFLITQKRWYGLPLALFLLIVLYNFEIAAAMLALPLIGLLAIGIVRKEAWRKVLWKRKVVFWSVFSFLLPLTPFLIYDFSHNFPQTLKFIAWVGYRFLLIFGYPPLTNSAQSFTWSSYLINEGVHLQRLLFLPNIYIAVAMFISSLFVYAYYLLKKKLYSKPAYLILSLWITSGLIGYTSMKTSSDAYLPLFLSSILIVVAISLSRLKSNILVVSSLILYFVFNTSYLLQNDYFVNKKNGYGPSLAVRQEAVKDMLSSTQGSRYTIFGSGEGSQFPSFIMNYSYLALYLKNPPSTDGKKFIFSENYNSVSVREERK